MVEAKQTARLSNNVDKQIQCTFTDRLVSYNSAFCNLRCFVCSNARISFPWSNVKLNQYKSVKAIFGSDSERRLRFPTWLKLVLQLDPLVHDLYSEPLILGLLLHRFTSRQDLRQDHNINIHNNSSLKCSHLILSMYLDVFWLLNLLRAMWSLKLRLGPAK